MMNRLRPSAIAALLAISMIFVPAAAGQENDFSQDMKAAWQEVGELRDGGADQASLDSVQVAYGWRFFEYHLTHPETPTGIDAGWQAFLFWSNAGSAADVDLALSRLDFGSSLYGRIMDYVRNAYAKDSKRTEEDIEALMATLAERLTHPAGRSAIYDYQASRLLESGDRGRASALYQQMVNLNANPFWVQKGLSALHAMESLEVGGEAPEFTAQTIDGRRLSLEELRGRPVLLVFWSTWCGPCIPEIPHYAALHERFANSGLEIVGVAMEDASDQLLSFVAENSMAWPVIADGVNRRESISQMYNVWGIPNSYLINSEGRIVSKNLRGDALISSVVGLMEGTEN